jgi:uncharacterized damage-inducible protein DinB
MTSHACSRLVAYKQWADRGLCNAIAAASGKLDAQDETLLLRILDHMHSVDSIFRHHLQGMPHNFHAPRSENLPDFETLVQGLGDTDEWYTAYAAGLTQRQLEEPVEFLFTSGKPARMRRDDMILHVCLHGTYHRGNAGVLLYRSGFSPEGDRLTDFLESTAEAAQR